MLKKSFFFGILCLALWACSEDDSGGPASSGDSFDRSAMLVNWADNIIIPAYLNFGGTTQALESAVASFTQNPSEATLQEARSAWQTAYIAFQQVSMFDIGPAETVFFRNRLNTYPANTTEIEDFIASGTYDLSLPSTMDAQGFPAMDYLLYGLGETDSEIVAFYSTNASATNYTNYLVNLAQIANSLTASVVANWNTGYRDTFVSNSGGSASASVDKLANDYVFYYEKALRAGKIGIPAGVFSNLPLPGNVEAFYKKDFSRQLALTSLQAAQDFFNGKHFAGNQTGKSFKSYLDYLNTIKNGEDLALLINAQFEDARAALNLLDENFVAQIEIDNSKMLNAFDELQRNVILLKVDMLQALDVNVDYIDADGD
ncbi:MAG: peptidase M75 superfamily protein [Flavobacteriaceae bacterium]|nr:peptidase M75 superfamily protein [Flavobacteriaceae bacterium]